MKKLLLILLIAPVIAGAQNLNEIVPKGSKIYIEGLDQETNAFAKKRLSEKNIYVISNDREHADFIMKFSLVSTGLVHFTGYADFIKNNDIVYTTKSVNSHFSTSHTGLFNYRDGVVDKLINRRIYPFYKLKN